MDKAYKLSFVAGGLLLPETAAIASRFLVQPDWEMIRKEVVTGKLLRTTRESSRARYFLEIRRRLKVAHPFELNILAGEPQNSRLANFAICCRYYQFLGDFMVDVVRDKLRLGDTSLGKVDFYSFFERQILERPELEKLSDSTRNKVRTVLFRMLVEAGIYDNATNTLSAPPLPKDLMHVYQHAGDSDALVHLLASEGK